MTPGEFKVAMPAFVSTDDAVIQRWLTAADPEFDVERWAGRYSRGLSNWVAHQIVMEGGTGADVATAGAAALATRKKVGQIEVQRSDRVAEMVAEDDFKGTRYGRVYEQMAAEVGMGAVAV